MSVLTIGDLTLDHILTHGIEQEPVYDDLAHLDYSHTRFRLNVRASINSELLPAGQGGVDNTSPSTIEKSIRHLLAQPRQDLTFTVGGSDSNHTLFNVKAPDVKNGPFPRVHSVVKIAGTETFIIDYSVEFNLVECPDAGDVLQQIASHRWRTNVRINHNFYSTLTTVGRVSLHVDAEFDNLSADSCKSLVLPPIPYGFRRDGIDWVVQEDGLALQYTVIDQEVYLQAPAPATKWDGQYIESTVAPGGGVRLAECRVRLEGPKLSDKGALISTAVDLCVNKVLGPTGVFGKDVVLRGAAVTEHLADNVIEVMVKAQLVGDPARLKALPLNPVRFNTAIPGVPDIAPDPGTRGSAGMKQYAPGFASPCQDVLPLVTVLTGQLSEDAPPPGGTPPSISLVPVLPTDFNSLWVIPLDLGLYTTYLISMIWRHHDHIIQLPIADDQSPVAAVNIKLAQTTSKLFVEWVAEREGGKPKLPHPCLGDPTIVRSKMEIITDQIEPTGDGTQLKYRVSGKYEYNYQNRASKLVSAVPPTMDSSSLDPGIVGYAAEDFQFGILNAGLPGTTGGCEDLSEDFPD